MKSSKTKRQDLLSTTRYMPKTQLTFWPPPAMRLLMYSGPSLCLRAFWMAWYSSAVYWLYNPEGNQIAMCAISPTVKPSLSFQTQHLFSLVNTERSWAGQQQESTRLAGMRLRFHPQPRGKIRHSCIHESKHCMIPYTKPNFMHSLKITLNGCELETRWITVVGETHLY